MFITDKKRFHLSLQLPVQLNTLIAVIFLGVGSPCPFPLLVHLFLKPGFINGKAVFLRDLPRQLHREPVSVIKPEHIRARDHPGPRAG